MSSSEAGRGKEYEDGLSGLLSASAEQARLSPPHHLHGGRRFFGRSPCADTPAY